MNALIKFLAITALLVTGCQTLHQDPLANIYDAQPNPGLKKEANYSGDILIGPDEKKIPITITWSTGKDTSGCLRIIDIKAKRTGGDPAVLASAVKHTFLPDCAMEFESEDETRFQTALISLDLEAKIGIKNYSFSGSVATIQGNGKFIAHNK